MSLDLSRLFSLAQERTAEARTAGVLQPFESRQTVVDDAGVKVVVRVLAALDRKPAPAGTDALGQIDPALELGLLEPGYRVVLNRFPVLPAHVLLVSREFISQEAPLEVEDFTALGACLDAVDAIGFYNAGPEAGASQRRRHLQLVPAPLSPEGGRTPIDEALRRNALPFPHAWGPRHRSAKAAHAAYRALLARVGCDPTEPYNLVATRDWMLVVPRARERFEDISVNALGFVGSLAVRTDAQLSLVRAIGPMRILRHVCA